MYLFRQWRCRGNVISGFLILNSITRNCGYLSWPVEMSYNRSPDIDTQFILVAFNVEETTKKYSVENCYFAFSPLQL